MLIWLKNLMYDPASFASAMRAVMFAVGELPQVVDFGAAGSELYWVGKVLQVAALAVRSNAGAPASPSTTDIKASFK